MLMLLFPHGKLILPKSMLSTPPNTYMNSGFTPNASFLNSQLITLLLVGVILTFSGFLLSYGCPINKKIWSPTYVLVTCGLASSFLALLIWIIDVKGYKKWSMFFEAFGVNPLFMYVLGNRSLAGNRRK